MRIGLYVLLTGLPVLAHGADEPVSTSQEQQILPEEITITSERSVPQLRTEMWKAEINAYDIFNKFNDEKRFNISCSMHQPTGTRIARQVCQAGFEIEATRAHGQDYLASLCDSLCIGNAPNSSAMQYPSVEAAIASQQGAYREKIRKVAEENPEFLEAIIRYTEVREQYERAARSGKEE